MIRLRDVMKTRVQVVSPRDSAATARERMRQGRIRHLVVTVGTNVVGVVSDRDLTGLGRLASGARVGDLMALSVVSGHPEMTLRQAANQLRGRSIGCLPVFEDERLVGIVTTTDLLDLIGRGIERPVAKGKRPPLRGRGSRRRAPAPASAATR
jgi:acetoin utilization protein AcuB